MDAGNDTCVLIACSMMEDEVAAACAKTGFRGRIVWVDRGYHEKPDVLRAKLQELIDEAERDGATHVLLAYGLCGKGTAGLMCRNAKLAMPRFDDCVNIMLCVGERSCRGMAQAGVMYLTRGWAHDASLVTGQRELFARKYGERRADRLMKAFYGSYRAVSLIDNGCYDIEEVRDYASACAKSLGVGVRIDEGGNGVLEKLIGGIWDGDILVCEPGRAVLQEDFDAWDALPA